MIQSAIDRVKTLLGINTPSAHHPAVSPPPTTAPMPAALHNFIRAANQPGPDQDWLMGNLKDQGISTYDFGKFCSAFATGADYVFRRFGTCPAGIAIVDMPEGLSTYYNAESRSIFISRQFIGRLISHYVSVQGKTDPHVLFAEHQAIAYGVEEAYHHYQWTSNPALTAEQFKTYRPYLTGKGPDENHDSHPFEAEAKAVVQEAMQHFGLNRMPIAPKYDPQWQARLTQERSSISAAPQQTASR